MRTRLSAVDDVLERGRVARRGDAALDGGVQRGRLPALAGKVELAAADCRRAVDEARLRAGGDGREG